MFKIGDLVIYSPDGVRGMVMEISGTLYHVIWEDLFMSWEPEEMLEKLSE